MLCPHVLANFVNDMLNGAFETGRNFLLRTVVIAQVPAESRTGKRGRSLGGIFYENSLDVREFFGCIVVMAVPVMNTVPLKLNVIGTSHNSNSLSALASMTHGTMINPKYHTALVDMRFAKLPASQIGWKSFVTWKLFLSGEFHLNGCFHCKFSLDFIFSKFGPFARSPVVQRLTTS